MRKDKVASIVTVIAALLLARRFGAFQSFGSADRLRRTLVALGARGQLAFVVAFTLLQPFGVPGTVFVMAAPLVWPWPVAFALSMTGTMLASVIGFSFARFVARDWVTDRIPARVRKYEDVLGRRAFATVFLLRLIFWMPQWLHVFFGVSKVTFWTHFFASLAGYILPLFLVSYFGQALFDALRGISAFAWFGIASTVLAVVFGVWFAARFRTPSFGRSAARRGAPDSR